MSETMKRILTSTGLGLLGVAVAVAITMAAGSLSSQSIGISAEPTTAGEQLAVPERTTATAPRRAGDETSPRPNPPRSRTQPAVDDDDRADEREDDREHDDDDRSGSDSSGRGDEDDGHSSNSGSGKDDDD